MTKAFVLIRMLGGSPEIDAAETPYYGFVLCDRIPGTQWGTYLISGTNAQLVAIDALPEVVGIVAVTQDGNVRWAELDDNLANTVRTKLNNWLSARGQQTIPAGWTNRQVVKAIYQQANAHWDLQSFDVQGPEDVQILAQAVAPTEIPFETMTVPARAVARPQVITIPAKKPRRKSRRRKKAKSN